MAQDLLVTDEVLEDPQVLRRLLSDIIERLDDDEARVVTNTLIVKIKEIIEVEQQVVAPKVQDGGVTTIQLAPAAATLATLIDAGGNKSIPVPTVETDLDSFIVELTEDDVENASLVIQVTGTYQRQWDNTMVEGTITSLNLKLYNDSHTFFPTVAKDTENFIGYTLNMNVYSGFYRLWVPFSLLFFISGDEKLHAGANNFRLTYGAESVSSYQTGHIQTSLNNFVVFGTLVKR